MIYVKKLRKAAVFLLTAAMVLLAGVTLKAQAADITERTGQVSASQGNHNNCRTEAAYGPVRSRHSAGSHVGRGAVWSGRHTESSGSAMPRIDWPVQASHKINQYFSRTHFGIDIGAAVHDVNGNRVVASMSGKVVYAGTLDGYGNVVYINSFYNGQPIQTRYAHLERRPVVSADSYVGAGQLVGYMGSTGESTGTHLHFEVRIRNSGADCIANGESTPVNPLYYV